MPEQQNIEYKSSWHDDYLKWVCGFANAQGGHIYIGKDDDGKITGLRNYKELMDEIPNKIKNNMGISADVNLFDDNGKKYIEIDVSPNSVAISLHGRYYYRSGSVKQELTGVALTEFLLKRSGLTWDEVIEPRATFKDIDEESFRRYLVMSKEKERMPDIDGLSTEEIFEKLRLTDNGKLKRAAIVLFGKDPKKFYTNAFVKIGRFSKDDTDIRFQDVEEGNIIVLLREVLSRLNHKYLIRPIEFEGILRLDGYEYPLPALREIILNALIHRTYMGAFIQIKVYDDKISIWNDGGLPEGITLESLLHTHKSKPRNDLIADVCFKGGLIDAWGRGTLKVIDACREAGLPQPKFEEHFGGFMVTLFKDRFNEEQLVKLGLNPRQVKAVLFVKEKGKITNSGYREINDVAERTALRDLDELVSTNVLKKHGEKKGAYYALYVSR
jgi:ATP-dependent DNA helicase RecG